jgi:hypothetical protein
VSVLIIGGGEGSTNVAAGGFMGLLTSSGSAEAKVEQLMTVSGTLSDIRVRLESAPGGGKGFTFTVRKNRGDTAVTCNITDTTTSTTSCSDSTHSVSFTADTDTISISVTTPSGKASANATPIHWTAKYTPS